MVDAPIPQGWIRFPDGSVGPPNSIGSDWNAPYRQPGGMGYPTSGILPPEAPGTPDQVSGRVGYPGIPTRTSSAMSAPALGGAGPEIIPPQNSTIPLNKSVGRFTGGMSTEGSYWDPRNWFKADPNATFEYGKPMPRSLTGPGGGGFNIGKAGFWPTLIESTLYPTPAETGEAPRQTLGRSPSGPGAPMPARPVTPTPATAYGFPLPPLRPTDTLFGNAPLPPPRPGVIPPNAVGVAPPSPPSSWFTTGDRPNMDVAGGGRSNRMQGGVLSPGGGPATMGMLDLSGLFGGGSQPAAAIRETPPNARTDFRTPATHLIEPGPMDPSIIARRKMKRAKASTSSQAGGY
jgi:hypothetical protein